MIGETIKLKDGTKATLCGFLGSDIGQVRVVYLQGEKYGHCPLEDISGAELPVLVAPTKPSETILLWNKKDKKRKKDVAK